MSVGAILSSLGLAMAGIGRIATHRRLIRDGTSPNVPRTAPKSG